MDAHALHPLMFKAALKLTSPILAAYWLIGLGSAVFALLVVYCFEGALTTGERLVPMLVATAVTMAAQLGRHQMMLSMALGTGLYMLLIRLIA